MTIILIILLVIVSIIACVLFIQWDSEKTVRQAMENPYDCSKRGHQFEAHYDEEFAHISENKVAWLSSSCLVNQADLNQAIRDASRIRSTYICHVCSICGKTINKGQADGPA